MANLRDIRSRIDSVENTKQVTRAMKMVATAKLRRAQERIFETRPYAYKMADIIAHLQRVTEPEAHRLFAEREEASGVLLIAVTADRGLAGAFNSNITRLTEDTIEERFAQERRNGNLHLLAVGKKGHRYFARDDHDLVGDFQGIFDDLQFETARDIAETAAEGYLDERWSEGHVVYNEFKNSITQNRIVEPVLPIPTERFTTPVMEEEEEDIAELDEDANLDFIFEPDAERILETLVPRYLNFQIWRVLLESNAAEQGARMVAMDNATTNAEELLEDLELTYNRARQDAITTEILEITSGAEALEEGR